MLIYRTMKDGTFLAGDTTTGAAEIALAESFWARRAKRQPETAARALLRYSRVPDRYTPKGRAHAQRNATIIKNLVELARRPADAACKSAVHCAAYEGAHQDA